MFYILSFIIIWEDRRPRLSRQTGFQPVSSLAIRFDMPNFGKTGVPACLGKRASSLFLHLPSVLTCQTTESSKSSQLELQNFS